MFTYKRPLGASLAASTVAASMLVGGVPPASADGQYKIELIALKCLDTEDTFGHDEVYLEVDDVRVWGPVDVKESSKSLELRTSVPLHQNAVIRLFDEDTGVGDKDDLLGEVSVSSDQVSQGTITHIFNKDGAKYRFSYRVISG